MPYKNHSANSDFLMVLLTEMKNPIELVQIKPWFLVTIGIMGSAMKIPLRNPNFITFTLSTSFPLFCMKLMPRLPYNLHQPSLIMGASFELRRLITHRDTLTSRLQES